MVGTVMWLVKRLVLYVVGKGQQVVGKMVSKEVSICLICVRYEVGVWSVKSSLFVRYNVFDQTISEHT